VVSGAQWQTRSVKELFILFLHAPGPLTKELVGELLWPGSAPAQLKLRFKNDLYRLRRAVGQDVVLFDGSAYRFNRDLDFEYDVDLFRNGLQRARRARDPQERLRFYQEAAAVVHGLYLEGIDSSWLLADREDHRQEYLSALLAQAELLLARRETDEALHLCQQALASDRSLEEAYRLTMRIHAARSDRKGVMRQYQACRLALDEELGVTPSVETETLYHQLTS
jgi:DNA-binding SARP family transcriptional activator